jgi:tungstate transport system ATP-binding protein
LEERLFLNVADRRDGTGAKAAVTASSAELAQVGVLYDLRGVQKTYNGRTVLDVADLSIQRGEVLALVGPSGAGKSTLLRLLAFLERSTAGELVFEGHLCDAEWPDLARRRQVTMVFQHPQLLRRSVYKNVAYGLDLRRQVVDPEQVNAVIEQMGLQALSSAAANTLSGGEAQRVALARALVLKPEVLLLDEPTANLDPYNINLIEGIVQYANRTQGTTVVVVTHNVFQAQRLADRVGLLLEGRLVEVSETDAFFNDPKRPETSAFVKGEIIY